MKPHNPTCTPLFLQLRTLPTAPPPAHSQSTPPVPHAPHQSHHKRSNQADTNHQPQQMCTFGHETGMKPPSQNRTSTSAWLKPWFACPSSVSRANEPPYKTTGRHKDPRCLACVDQLGKTGSRQLVLLQHRDKTNSFQFVLGPNIYKDNGDDADDKTSLAKENQKNA